MSPRHRSTITVMAVAMALALPGGYASAQDAQVPAIRATASTQRTASGENNDAAIVRNDARPGASRIIATAALDGLEISDLSGKRLATVPAGEAAAVDAMPGVTIGKHSTTVVAAVDETGHFLRLYTFDNDRLAEAGARPIPLGFAAEGICLFRSPRNGALQAFIVGDGGEVDQQVIHATADGRLDARQVRRIHLPSPLTQCVADAAGHVYVSEEAVGIWRFNADAEADTEARVVDAPRLGRIEEEVSGVALYDGGDGSRWLLAGDASAGHVNVYDRDRDDAWLGAFAVAAPDGGAVEEPGLLAATGLPLGKSLPHGALLVVDEDAADTKLVAIADIARALGLDPGNAAAAASPDTVPAVTALVETTPVSSFGDAADDPAIWANPDDPAASLVIATDKKAGLYVYDMRGQVVQFLPDGKMNNVDLREGFELGGEKVVLVTASNRTDDSIAIYRLDTTTHRLVDVADGVQPTGFDDPYGLCMYRSPRDGSMYVFVNGDDTGKRQWRLVDAGNGRVRTELVREMTFDSQTEGCVADDDSETLYVNEEDVAMWRMSAEPGGDGAMTAVERIADNPAIRDDLEGMGIYHLGDGRGYIVASSQGNDTYAVYRLEGRQEYLGSFAVVADPARGIDGISETDGLEVTSSNLGPGFEHGAMIAQDGRNVMPVENQNYKYVAWEAIARALDLEMR